MFIKVNTLPGGAHDYTEVPAMIFVGPGVKITPSLEKGLHDKRSKITYPDGRSDALAHSFGYMEALIMGELQRPGIKSDVEAQLDRT